MRSLNVARFADHAKRIDHFARHGGDFGARSAADYEALADAFLSGPKAPSCHEKTRPNGDIVRYDPATEAFGIVKADGTIRTFYKPDPAVHGYASNLDYYHAQ